MNLIRAWQQKRALTPEQKLIVRHKRIEGEHTPVEWLGLLTAVAQYDRTADRARVVDGWLMGLSGVGAFICFIVLLLPLAIVALGVFVLALVHFLLLRRSDLPDRLHHVLMPLLGVLREELAPGERLHLTADLGDPVRKQNRKRQDPSFRSGRYNVTVSHFEHPWLSGGASLADGSRLEWGITDHVVEKRKSSSKKTKTKYKTQSVVNARVALPEKRYAATAAAPDATPGADKLAVQPKEKRTVFKLSRVVRSQMLATVRPADVLELLASAYRRVAVAKD